MTGDRMTGSGYTGCFTGNTGDKPCPGCGRSDGRITKGCRACHASYMRWWRAGNQVTWFERQIIRWLREHFNA